MTFISIVLEIFRRAQWSLLRVENEQNNNFEQYRTIPIIPPIVENEDETKDSWIDKLSSMGGDKHTVTAWPNG